LTTNRCRGKGTGPVSASWPSTCQHLLRPRWHQYYNHMDVTYGRNSKHRAKTSIYL